MSERIFGLSECYSDPENSGIFFTERDFPQSVSGTWGIVCEPINGVVIRFAKGRGIGDSLSTVIQVEGREPSDWNLLEWERLANSLIGDKLRDTDFEEITENWRGVFRGIRREDTESEKAGVIHALHNLTWRLVFPSQFSGDVVLGALRAKAALDVLRVEFQQSGYSHQWADDWERYPQEFKDKYYSLLALEEQLRRDILFK